MGNDALHKIWENKKDVFVKIRNCVLEEEEIPFPI